MNGACIAQHDLAEAEARSKMILLGINEKYFELDTRVSRKPALTYLKMLLDKLGERKVVYVIW